MKDKNKLVVGLVMKSLQADFFKVMQEEPKPLRPLMTG